MAIQGMPGIGSPRLGQITGIEGLRSWSLPRFPVRWFYIERDEYIDVVRLLGERQDLEAILGGEPAAPL
jgi:toxin ParE1/3/4